MWFKNLRIYRLTGTVDVSVDRLETELAKHAFVPCGKAEFSRFGWVPPLGRHGEMLTHAVGPFTMICARRQEKILPAAAINEMVDEKVEAFEAAEARSIYRRERIRLKDEVVLTLLPRALTRSSLMYAYFDTQQKLLIIDAATPAKAEDFLESLRAVLVELPVVPLVVQSDVSDILTRWVEHGAPQRFDLDDECELQSRRESRNVVRCRNQELESAEILSHLKAGKRVMQLAAVWRQAIRFVLSEDLAIKRLRFEDKIRNEAEGPDDDEVAQFDQDFAVMTVQLRAFIDDLVSEFGGLEE
ncbi:MAG: recombination-associated protein RdgC [Pseudomonadota bacterium]